nr:hypothetical protein [Herbaspirillum sp. ASV7]
MDKSDSAHSSDLQIAIQQGDWTAYCNHIGNYLPSQAGHAPEPEKADEREDDARGAYPNPGQDAAGLPLHGEEDILAYRRRCARAYIGMNGRLGGRAYHANEPVILTQDAVQELAELNRLLREERAQKKKAG